MLSGAPNNDQFYFCPANGSSCYYYVSASLSFNDSKTNCRNRGGYLVSYNTGGPLGWLHLCSAVVAILP